MIQNKYRIYSLSFKKQTYEVCLSLYCSTGQYLYDSYTDMEGNIRYTDRPRVVVRTSENDIAGGEGNISFPVRTMIQGQSVYPDISLHISNYYVYWIEDQNLTHNINAQNFLK